VLNGINAKTMANANFQFKQFNINQDRAAMKVTTDGCLFGAWCAQQMQHLSIDFENCLDIGAGTGLLSLMIAQKNRLSIDAVEIEKGAALQAAENTTDSPFSNINTIHGNIADIPLPDYDWIVCNPPFYEKQLASPDHLRNIAHHDQQLKWTTLFEFITHHLKPGGRFFLLLPYKRKDELEDFLKSHGLYLSKMVMVKPSVSHPPFRIMIEGCTRISLPVIEELAVKDSEGNYTEAFVALLEDYYLYL
jgi:tRNA1Val (adenine37-N6)-methyltransferase